MWEEYCHKIFIVIIVLDDCTIFGEGDVRDPFSSSVQGKPLRTELDVIKDGEET